MSEWSLEKELCKLSGGISLQNALFNLGLINYEKEMFSIRRDTDWVRGGDETYIYRFWVQHGNGKEDGYIIKACVALDLHSSINGILQKWVKRRNLLFRNGVATPKLIICGYGVIVEELIPYDLKSILLDTALRQGIFIELASTIGIVARLGFEPITILHNLRSRGSDVVMVDFGQDLGSPSVSETPKTSLYDHLIKELKQWEVSLPEHLLIQMNTFFLASCIGGN